MPTLDELMNQKKESHPISFDLTKGRKIENAPTNEKEETPAPELKKKAVVINNGHVNLKDMQPIKSTDILPPRKEPTTPFEDDIYAQLDAAVEREKKSIDERIDAVLEARDAEIEKQEEEAIDAMATGNSTSTSNESKDNYFDDDDEETTTYTHTPVKNKVKFNLDDAEVKQEAEAPHTNVDNMIDKYVYDKEPVVVEDIKTNVINVTKPDAGNDQAEVIAQVPIEEVKTEEVNPVKVEETTTVSTLETKVDPVKIEPAVQEDLHTMNKTSGTSKIAEPAGDNIIREDIKKNTQIIDGIDNDSLFDDDDDDSSSTSDAPEGDQIIETLKKEIKEKAPSTRRNFDLSKFTIAKKAVSASKVMKLAIGQHQYSADWVMYSAKRPVSCTGLSGPEILKLNPENTSRNRLNTFRDMYRIIYDHIYDGNKPDFEIWLKQVRFVDLPHIYFALYMATFSGSNFVHYTCPKCQHTFIKDITFESMVEYASDEAKAKVRSILSMDSTSPSNDSYPVDLVQISDNYVFGLRTPSVWNVIIEIASLSDNFVEKYADMIDIITYIDSIYLIDSNNDQLIPIDTKPDPNDMAKTAGRKIKAYYDIITKLSSDDFYYLRSCINKCDDNTNDISYQIPAAICPKCAAEIAANKEITPDSMLFTRHQLAAIGNM